MGKDGSTEHFRWIKVLNFPVQKFVDVNVVIMITELNKTKYNVSKQTKLSPNMIQKYVQWNKMHL